VVVVPAGTFVQISRLAVDGVGVRGPHKVAGEEGIALQVDHIFVPPLA
jgi:hypothetical protein